MAMMMSKKMKQQWEEKGKKKTVGILKPLLFKPLWKETKGAGSKCGDIVLANTEHRFGFWLFSLEEAQGSFFDMIKNLRILEQKETSA